jgi:hypothetical protein
MVGLLVGKRIRDRDRDHDQVLRVVDWGTSGEIQTQ